MIAIRVPAEYAGQALNLCWRLVARACSRGGGLIASDLAAACYEGTSDLWLMGPAEAAPVAVGVTRTEEWPEGRIVRVLCVGGNRARQWIEPFREALRVHARETGAVKIVTEARVGWAPIFSDLKPKRYIYEEEIR
jgi:hypothetical protein